MNACIQHLKASERKAVPWKNGGGVTSEVARDSQSRDTGAFQWRVSVAEVSREGPFSHFPDCRRLISVVGGQGMELHAAGQGAMLLKPYEVHEFDGSSDVSGRLPFGAVRDLNVIFQPACVRASLRFSDRGGEWWPLPGQTVILINVQAASVSCATSEGGIELACMDAVLAAAGASLSLPGGSVCAVIELA